MVYGYQQLNQNTNYVNPQNAAPQQFGANVPLNNGNNNPYGQNFTAIDTQQLKQDAIELSNKATEQVEENSQLGMMKQMFGIDFKNHPKRTAISLALVLATCVSLAALGNSKLSTEIMPNLGHAVDDILKKSKLYNSVTGVFTGAKNGLTGFLRKSKTIDNIFDTLKNNKAKAKCHMAKGGGTGARRIFEMTPPDTVKTALDFSDIKDAAGEIIKDAAGNAKRHDSTISTLKKLVGNETTANDLYDTLAHLNPEDNGKACKKITEAIAKNFGCMDAAGNINKRNLDTILHQLKSGTITGLDGKLNIDVSELTDIVMDGGLSKTKGPIKKALTAIQGIMGAWWPTNAINKVIDVLHLPVKHIGRGNFGDALIKYNVVSGNLADKKLAQLVQKSLIIPTESISNFVNDKSGAGVMISLMALTNLYNNVQEAPKEKKGATMADDLISGVGSFTITMPMAFGVTYGLASLANMEKGKGIFSGPLRMIGKFFGMGLDPVKNGVSVPKKLPFNLNNKVLNTLANAPAKLFRSVKGLGGGALRFALVTMVFSSIFMKPMRNVIHKIFGKPYDPAEEEALKAQQAQAEALKNLNMTEEQMMTKLQAHPEFVQALQNDPQTLAAIEQNPVLLLQMIAALPDTPAAQTGSGQFSAPQNPQNKGFNINTSHSQLLDSYINSANANNVQPKAPAPQINTPNQTPSAPQTPVEPVRTYIPSSSVNLPQQQVQPDVQQETVTNPNVQAIMEKADRAMDDAMKFLS